MAIRGPVDNGIPLLNTGGLAQTDQGGIYFCYDQTLPAVINLDCEIVDVNNNLVTIPNFEINVIIEIKEIESELEKIYGPGPMTLLEHPWMRGNFNAIRQ